VRYEGSKIVPWPDSERLPEASAGSISGTQQSLGVRGPARIRVRERAAPSGPWSSGRHEDAARRAHRDELGRRAGDTRCRADRCQSEASELVMTITERPIASSVREPQGSLRQQRGVTAGRTDVLAGGR
jgi:hypothetical protein